MLASPGQSGGWETTKFMAQNMKKLGMEVWTPGERELFFGMDKFKELVQAMGSEVVSANLTDGSGKMLFKDRLVLTRGPIKIGITGVTSRSVFEGTPVSQNQGRDEFGFKDMFDSVKPVVADLRKSTDVVVVLAHVGPADARRLADEIPGIDVVVVGHNPGYMYNPDRIGDVLLVRNGNRGQYAAKVVLTLDAQKRIADYKGTNEPLNEGITVEPNMGSEIAKFQEEVTKQQAQEARERALASADSRGGNKYLGDEVCARCHSDIYTKWSKSPHASAYQTLVKANKQTDLSCIGCHVTGYGDATGYQTLVYSINAEGKSDTTDSVTLRNVQCESCHGKGTMHGTEGMVTKVTKEACVTCHDAANDPDFNFEKAIAAGLHH